LGDALEATMYEPNPPLDIEFVELVDWAKLRMSYIAQNESAAKLLIRLWPEGLPTPKQGWSREQVDEVNALCSKVEAEFTLTFVEGGPQSSGPSVSTRKRGRK
jgi:hypothetical protein